MLTAGAVARGLRNPFRSRVRAEIVVGLLALVTGLSALMAQAALRQILRLSPVEAMRHE